MTKVQPIEVGDVLFSDQAQGITVEARVSRVEDDEFWAELTLKGDAAAQKWEADAVTDNTDVYAFGVWMDGPGLPVWWGDLDQDGKPELLAPAPKADLSPPVFRIFRWTGDDLLFLKRRALLADSEGRFRWSQLDDDFEEADWIENFVEGQAEVLSLKEGYLKREMVDVEPTDDGFRKIDA